MLSCTLYDFHIRPIGSTGQFNTIRKPHLAGPIGHGILHDASYDPVTDQIYWIEQFTDWNIEGSPTTTSIGRCDYDGSNPELLVEGINTGATAIGNRK